MAAYKRKIYLIDPKFQIKFSLSICLILFVSSLIYPFTIYDLMSQFINYAASHSTDIAQTIDQKRKSLIIILILWQLGFTALVFIIGIFFSHKIAGPIYKLKKHLRMIRDGQASEDLYFRQGDHFHDLADEINDTFNTLREEYRNDFVYLSEVNAYINNLSLVVPDDKKPVLSEIHKKLSDIQKKFEYN